MIGLVVPGLTPSPQGARGLGRLDVEASSNRGGPRRSRRPLTSGPCDVVLRVWEPGVLERGGDDLALA